MATALRPRRYARGRKAEATRTTSDSERGWGPASGRKMKARVFVTLKPSVFDPQGRTIADALHSMGYTGVGDVRQGKYFELEVDAASASDAKTLVSDVADKLLANPVIESYRVEV